MPSVSVLRHLPAGQLRRDELPGVPVECAQAIDRGVLIRSPGQRHDAGVQLIAPSLATLLNGAAVTELARDGLPHLDRHLLDARVGGEEAHDRLLHDLVFPASEVRRGMQCGEKERQRRTQPFSACGGGLKAGDRASSDRLVRSIREFHLPRRPRVFPVAPAAARHLNIIIVRFELLRQRSLAVSVRSGSRHRASLTQGQFTARQFFPIMGRSQTGLIEGSWRFPACAR